MACEVICTELVCRVKSEFNQIVCPCGKSLPVLLRIGSVILHIAYRSREDNHVPGLFNRHVASVYLSVGKRVCPDVMGCERLGPFPALRIVEDVVHHRFRKLRVVVQEYR